MRASDVRVVNLQPEIPSPSLNSYSFVWNWMALAKVTYRYCLESEIIDVLFTDGGPKALEKHAVVEDEKGREVEPKRKGYER